ncbi:hypothetical protein [Pelagibius sp. Alg239-R121]|uniref:hypothetical protein n=1 Tax=Pelagibius sp. Alg239-R121 TaxID=2993448 RepID=UPI0024A77253|nr:hypothetical protein [Pelagibius sp. Alg239-R121]
MEKTSASTVWVSIMSRRTPSRINGKAISATSFRMAALPTNSGFSQTLTFSCHRIEYWFLDWFAGAHRTLSGSDEALLCELWDWFRECGLAQDAFEKAKQV